MRLENYYEGQFLKRLTPLMNVCFEIDDYDARLVKIHNITVRFSRISEPR